MVMLNGNGAIYWVLWPWSICPMSLFLRITFLFAVHSEWLRVLRYLARRLVRNLRVVAASVALGLVAPPRCSLSIYYPCTAAGTLVLEQSSRTRVLALVWNYSLARVQVPYIHLSCIVIAALYSTIYPRTCYIRSFQYEQTNGTLVKTYSMSYKIHEAWAS